MEINIFFFHSSQISEIVKTSIRHQNSTIGLSQQRTSADAYALALISDSDSVITEFNQNIDNGLSQAIFQDDVVQFKSMQYALFVTCFVEILGGVFFLLASMYILGDKKKVEEAISGIYYSFFIN